MSVIQGCPHFRGLVFSCISIFLQGTLTSCILPEAGVYEIDGRIRLYLTHQSCLNLCRGLRVGATVELYNVHVLKVTAVSFKVWLCLSLFVSFSFAVLEFFIRSSTH